jgi:ATP adenylyltransferase/5',5'''-P-1,P-4-tetraphosphate phosphorylase II
MQFGWIQLLGQMVGMDRWDVHHHFFCSKNLLIEFLPKFCVLCSKFIKTYEAIPGAFLKFVYSVPNLLISVLNFGFCCYIIPSTQMPTYEGQMQNLLRVGKLDMNFEHQV